MYILPNQYLVQKFSHFDYLGGFLLALLAALSQTMPTHPVCAGNQRERCFHKSLCVFISVVLQLINESLWFDVSFLSSVPFCALSCILLLHVYPKISTGENHM